MEAFSSSERSPTSSHSSSKLLKANRKPPAVKKPFPPRHASGAFSSTSTRAPCSRAESAAQRAALPPPITMTSYAWATGTPSAHDLADLDLWRDVGEVGHVGEQLLAVRLHRRLKGVDRLEIEVTDARERGGRARRAGGEPLVHLPADEAEAAEALLDERHVLLQVVVVVELLPLAGRVQHGNADHREPSMGRRCPGSVA